MRYLFPTLLLIAVVLSLASSCEPDIIEPPIPPPPPFSCANGYEPNAAEDDCLCPSPRVELYGIECYEIPSGAFYSELAGCYMDAGAIYELEYDTSRFIESENAFRIDDARYAIPNPDLEGYRSNPANAFLYERDGRWDSLRIVVEDPFSYAAFQHPDLLGIAATEFNGIWRHPDTIDGYFIFGYVDHASPLLWAIIELERCPATLVRH